MKIPNYEEFVIEMWRTGELHPTLKPTQLEIHNWWNGHDAALTVAHCRRDFGKTWWMLTEAFSFMGANPKTRQVYAAMSREDAKKIVIPTAQLLIPEFLPREIKPVWSASDHAYYHPNGAMLIIEGANDDMGAHLRGPFADRAYLDELAFWRFAKHVWKAVIFPMIERRNGRAIGVSTSPESPMHEFATVIIPEAQTEGAYVKVTIDDDYTMTQERKDRIAAQYSSRRDPEEGRKSTIYMREYMCELVAETERAVVPEFKTAVHVREIERPDYFDCYTVLDLGMRDLTHCLFSYYDWKEGAIVIAGELAINYKTVSELAPLIHQRERELWGDKKPRKRVSDADPMELAEFARQHLLQPHIVPREMRFAAAQNRNPDSLINRMRSLVASDRVIIHPSCVELVKQLAGGLWNEKRTDFERTPGLGHLDGIMALSYTVDTIDYATDPEQAQKKYNREHYGVELGPKPVRDAQNATLQKLLPKVGRRPDRKPNHDRMIVRHR